MQRFWTHATVAEAPDGFGIHLDGKPVRLPGGAPLRVVQRPLAQAIADEWAAAGGGVRGGRTGFDDLPLTRLTGTAQERIAPDPGPATTALAAYGATDLLCYRAEDPGLAARQAEAWQPWLDWLAWRHGASLCWTTGLMPIAQDADALAALHRAIGTTTPLGLAALGILVPALGSLVLGLAVRDGALAVADAHVCATIDEAFQQAAWGIDPEAAERRARIAEDLGHAGRLLALAAG